MKIKKKNEEKTRGGVRLGGHVWGGGQVGCERRSKVFVKIKKERKMVGRVEGQVGGQGGCER